MNKVPSYITPDLADKALAELCRRDFFRFVKEFWSEIIGEDPVWNWHIPYLCSELQELAERVVRREPKLYDLVINIPPGSTKSTIATVMFPAWAWTRDASLRFITGSYSKDLSLEHAGYSRDIIKSEKFRRLFPEIEIMRDKDLKSNYKNSQKGQRFSTSVGGTVTGIHAHIIAIDDPLNPKQAASEAELKTANEWMGKTLSTRKVDKSLTPTILIMQRLHENDPSGVWIDKRPDHIKHICLPAEDSERVSPQELREEYIDGLLDPVRIPLSVVDDMKTTLGSYGYAGQFDQAPSPGDGGIFKKHWFPSVTWAEFEAAAHGHRVVWDTLMDGAYTEDTRNDPSGFIAHCKIGANYFIRMASSRWLEQPDLEKFIPSFAKESGYGPSSVIAIEPKANGLSTAQSMKARSDLNIVIDEPPDRDKISRARDVSAVCEAGRVYLIQGPWNDEYRDQMGMFPNATHDEYVDLTCMMIQRARRMFTPDKPKSNRNDRRRGR